MGVLKNETRIRTTVMRGKEILGLFVVMTMPAATTNQWRLGGGGNEKNYKPPIIRKKKGGGGWRERWPNI